MTSKPELAPILEQRYITAPFIMEENHQGKTFYRRIDPHSKNTLLMKSPLAASLLELCQVLCSEMALLEKIGDKLTDTELHEAIHALVRGGFLIPEHEIQVNAPSVELELTNICNANCVMCPRAELRPLGKMNDSTFERTLLLLRSFPTSGVLISGIGEATILPQIVERVRAIKGAIRHAPLGLVSNGFNLNSDLLAKLKEAGLDLLQWSFHSLREDSYNQIMGVKRFEVAKRNFEECARDFADMMMVNMVQVDINADEPDSIGDWMESHGLSRARLAVIPCFSRGGFIDSKRLFSRSSTRRDGRCLFVRKTIFVAWNGDILPCSNDIKGENLLANIGRQNPEEVVALWRDKLLANPLSYDICHRCNQHTRGTLDTEWFHHIRGRAVKEPF